MVTAAEKLAAATPSAFRKLVAQSKNGTAYEQTGISTQGKVEGYFTARGIRPKFADKLDRMGRTFPAEMFHVNPLARKGA